MDSEMRKKYNAWLSQAAEDQDIASELQAMADNEARLHDCFCRDLAFGTGGLRGEMGAGTNRINRYTIRKATQGLADHLLAAYGGACKERGVAIAYDSRNHSKAYALETALVLCRMGIPAYLFRELMPTPVLSFTVRHLHTVAGVVITASHNPKEYNGYKVYDATGCQAVPGIAKAVTEKIEAIEDMFAITPMGAQEAMDAGLLHYIGDDVLDAFLGAVGQQAHTMPNGAKQGLKVVYTPLHGAGNRPVREMLAKQGYTHVSVVAQQELPDGDFPTVRSPNPEDPAALHMGIGQAQKTDADLVIGTDPDCDRVGVAVRDGREYRLLTGNQTGALLLSYILLRRRDRLPADAAVVKTIVTSELGAAIARASGLNVIETLTGFKYIGKQADKLGAAFVFGYEESYGYLAGTHALDKDAVAASMLICEMAAYYKANGKTLLDELQGLYSQYGFYLDRLDSFTLKGEDGMARIRSSMDRLRRLGAKLADGVISVTDYVNGAEGLPNADVLKYRFANGSWLAVRPSGTEPKLKAYYSIKAEDPASANKELARIRAAVDGIVQRD